MADACRPNDAFDSGVLAQAPPAPRGFAIRSLAVAAAPAYHSVSPEVGVMNRRAFVTGLGAVLAAPLVVKAQPPKAQPPPRITRIAYVTLGTAIPNAGFCEAFTDRLRDHGWERNSLIEYHPADESGPTYLGGMAFVDDPLASAFVPELTPDTAWLSLPLPETSGKRVEFLREVAATVARVAVLSHASLPSISADVRETEAAAQKLGMPVHVVEVGRKSELDEAFAAIAQERATGVIVRPSMMLYLWRGHIARLAMKHQLPAVTSVQAGCLMSYGPDLPDLARRAAYFMDKLFSGAAPADLQVEQPTKCELVINLKTAKALGLTIPPSLLLRANQVIE
jgi:hypothetical protein